jgi:hypothetical protein
VPQPQSLRRQELGAAATVEDLRSGSNCAVEKGQRQEPDNRHSSFLLCSTKVSLAEVSLDACHLRLGDDTPFKFGDQLHPGTLASPWSHPGAVRSKAAGRGRSRPFCMFPSVSDPFSAPPRDLLVSGNALSRPKPPMAIPHPMAGSCATQFPRVIRQWGAEGHSRSCHRDNLCAVERADRVALRSPVSWGRDARCGEAPAQRHLLHQSALRK